MTGVADDSKSDSRSVIGSYVAVGDSFTEGVGDPGPDGAFVGWADRFAVLLADRWPEGDFGYTNLAVRGKLLDQIMEDQLTRAVRLAPDLVSFCAGGNDILRPGTDPDEVAERFERAIASLTAAAGTLVPLESPWQSILRCSWRGS